MPIAATDLGFFLSANMPTDDTGTSGGAISTVGRPDLTQLTASAVVAAVSDGADTRTLTVYGRASSGVLQSESKALSGTTEVTTTATFERILRVTLSATDAARTVTVRQGAGGATRATIRPNESESRALFYNSTSEAASAVRYEKVFGKNLHASLSLLSAQVTLTADPAARIMIGLAGSVNDTGSVANRKTAPAGVTFVDDGVAVNVPGTDLAAGAAIGVWCQQTLPANDPPNKTTFTLQLSGSTI